jgi:UDP-2,3-diacylglucosamine hydrolase
MKPLIFVSDAHLTRNDPELDAFVAFLEKIASRASTLAILGDLFNIWFGRPKFALPHHERVLASLASLGRSGVRLVYVEGNRDFHLRRAHLGNPFDAVTEGSLIESHAGWRIWATHGDEINQHDRPYRTWKAFSKSTPVYGAFSMLPGSWGMSLGESLERKLTGTNIKHKSRFPEEQCVAYAKRIFEQGCHALVLGHFHEERHIACGEREGRPLGVYVLPAWRNAHRYLVFEGDAPPRFRTFGG